MISLALASPGICTSSNVRASIVQALRSRKQAIPQPSGRAADQLQWRLKALAPLLNDAAERKLSDREPHARADEQQVRMPC